MKARCLNKKDKQYYKYGGRGITICERWMKYRNFLADMGRRPTPYHSLDRHPDGKGNYEPGNCRWADDYEQNQNTVTVRPCKIDGTFYPSLGAAERAIGVSRKAIRRRIKSKVPGYIGVKLEWTNV